MWSTKIFDGKRIIFKWEYGLKRLNIKFLKFIKNMIKILGVSFFLLPLAFNRRLSFFLLTIHVCQMKTGKVMEIAQTFPSFTIEKKADKSHCKNKTNRENQS